MAVCFAEEDPMFTFDKANRRAKNMSEMMDLLGLHTDAFAQRRLGLDLSSAIHLPVLQRARGLPRLACASGEIGGQSAGLLPQRRAFRASAR
jgi:hypothetical protein